MADIGNMDGYRSVYMAFGAFRYGMGDNKVNTVSTGKAQAVADGNEDQFSFMTAINNASEKFAVDDEEDLAAEEINSSAKSEASRPDTFLSYTRIITTQIPKDMAAALENGTTGSPFDISDGSQELKITINVSGGSRIYTASGTDKNGNSFSKEIDPYNVDPTDADYADFATLCAYIRDTEGMADNTMQAVKDAAPSDITEKGNYLYKVGFYAETNGNLSGAKKLFEQMESFFDRLMGIGKLDASESIEGSKSIDGVETVSIRSAFLPDEDYAATGVSTKSEGGSFYSRLLDELHEMIQKMMQKMLNELLGIEDDDLETEESIDAIDGENAAEVIISEKAIEVIDAEEENPITEALDMSEAVTL